MPSSLEDLRAALAGRYKIEKELGAGGMAIVYLADDLRHDRQVALKVLRPEISNTLGSERFLREIHTAAQLNHPHIMSLLDSGEADGFLYYAMPYVDGESLAERIDREKQLPLDEAKQIVSEIADGLGYAHSQGVIHRDIKPENIMLWGGHAVIADFGIATAVTTAGGTKLTETGIAIGTARYMSPEQASGSDSIDARSDLYSLGCVLYETLVGEPPFQGTSPQAVMARHAVDRAPPIRTVRPSVPMDLENIVGKALDKVPADRFQSAEQFVRALTGEIKVTPTGAEPIAVRQRLTAGRKVGLAVIAAVVAIAGSVWILDLIREPPTADVDPFRLAVFPLDVQSSDPEHDYLASGVMNLLGILLEGAGEISVVDHVTMRGALAGTDPTALGPDSARSLATSVQAGRYLFGILLNVGDKLSIRASLWRSTDVNPPEQFSVDGPEDKIDSLVTDLAVQILAHMGAGGAGRLADLGEMPTGNWRALKAYLQGLDYLQYGHYDSAIVALEEAVEEDPAMADAWYMLSWAHEWSVPGNPAGYRTIAEAYAHLDRATERNRVVTEATYALWYGEAEDAERLALDALAADRDLAEAWYILGLARLFFRWQLPAMEDGIPAMRKATLRNPDNLFIKWNYTWALRNQRAYGEVDSIYQQAQEDGRVIFGSQPQALFSVFVTGSNAARDSTMRALSEATLRTFLFTASWLHSASDSVRWAQMVGHAVAEDPTHALSIRASASEMAAHSDAALGQWDQAREDFQAADRSFPGLIVNPGTGEYGGYPFFAYALLAVTPFIDAPTTELEAIRDSLRDWIQPDFPETITEVRLSLIPELRDYLLALYNARLGDYASALTIAEELQQLRHPGDSVGLLSDLAFEIRALVAIQDNRLEDALALVNQAQWSVNTIHNLVGIVYSRPLGRLLRADLSYELGRRQEALGWYGGFPYLMNSSPAIEEAYLSHIYGRMGQIYDEMGDKENAIGYYRRFVARWQDADAQFRPRVDSAKARLAALQ